MDKQENLIFEQEQVVVADTTWTTKILGLGAAIGAVTGIAAAYLLVQQTKKRGVMPTLEAGEGIRLGLLLLGLLRQVALLGRDE